MYTWGDNLRFRVKRLTAMGAMFVLGASTVCWAGTMKNPPPKKAIEQAESLSEAFAYAAAVARPSVVSIRAVTKVTTASHWRNGRSQTWSDLPFNDDFLERFFGGRIQPHDFVQQGTASGVVVSEDGYILTNNHVVDGADELEVTLNDGRQISAKVVATDPPTDLAVIRIHADNLTPAQFGDSDALKVGTWVLAVGDPLGLNDTITAGIISAQGRSNVRIAAYEDFIQTDAAINPGNSGGPLINLSGAVIGINTAIASRSGGSEGLGFAIPINMASRIMQSLIAHGHVARGYLGVLIQPLNKGLSESFGYKGTDGVLIGDVTSGGPGAAAGLETGDIVEKFDGTEIHDVNQLRNLVAGVEPNHDVPLEVFRDGHERTITVRVGTLPEQGTLASASQKNEGGDLGLSVEDVGSQAARQFELPDTEGALVTEVDATGPAALAGIQAGDVIVDVQGTKVRNAREFREQVQHADLAQGIRMVVKNAAGQRFVFLQERQ